MPHECRQPATTRLNFTSPATETGIGERADVPVATAGVPTSQRWFSPQHRPVPSVVTPHVVMRPTEMLDQNDPSTRVYELPDRPTFPSPNSPSPARPQQNARLSGAIPHVCCDGPMDNDARVAGDVPAVGGSVIFTGVGLDGRSTGPAPYSRRVELSPQQYSAPAASNAQVVSSPTARPRAASAFDAGDVGPSPHAAAQSNATNARTRCGRRTTGTSVI